MTGLTLITPEVSGKRLALLKEAFPRRSRVAILWNAADSSKVLDYRETESAARTLGVTLQSVEFRSTQELDSAFSAIARGRADALVAVSDPLTLASRQRIVEFAAKNRLPAIYAAREFVDAGGLIGYGVSYPHLYHRAASFVDKILKGAKPGDLPVEQPTKFELVINLKTARTLGLNIPQSLLARADEVIQ